MTSLHLIRMMLGDLAVDVINRPSKGQFLVAVRSSLRDPCSWRFILIFDKELLLLVLHDHALESLNLLIVWCQSRGVLRLALLR